MKDAPVSSSKSSRTTAYPKKRPSPHGISKRRNASPLAASTVHNCRSPNSTRPQAASQRQKSLHVVALHRDALLEDEYREEILLYMQEMERYTMGSVISMDQQPEIKWSMRPCLVEFLVELHFTFRLRPETLYLAINIVDRYVSRRVVYLKHYQLVGCAALWIAAKFEDAKDRVPAVGELVHYCREEYDESAFHQMEGHVLQTIQFVLGHPTAEAWLRILCCGHVVEEIEVQHVARFLMEITLFYREFVNFPSSSIAIASLTLARFLCNKSRRYWQETEEALEIADLLDERLASRMDKLSETLVKKYSYAFYSKAATHVVEFYLHGKRFVRNPLAHLPITPNRSTISAFSTPMSTGTSVSDISDHMPMTPSTPEIPGDPFSSFATSSDKENAASTFSVPKVNSDASVEQYLPHGFVTVVRPALQSYNASPRAVVS